MREELRAIKERNRLSDAKVGELIGVGQQTANSFLRGKTGLGRASALRLAIQCGYDSPETMLRELGVLASASDAKEGWADRDLAVGIARRLRYDEAVIQRVIAKFTEDRYKSMTARWWNDRIVHEAAEVEAEKLVPPAPASSPMPVEEPAKKRRRKAG